MEYGIQMYSLRDITGNDMIGALKAVADMGYRFVEFAGTFGISASNMKTLLDNNGLYCYSTHSGLGDLLGDNLERTLAYWKELGCHSYIIPGHDLSSQAKLDEFIAAVNEIQPKVEAAGLTLGYHNHSHEFIPNSDGSMIHQQLEDKTDLKFEIDTYWTYNAKVNSVEILNRLKDRIEVIHLKDGNDHGQGFSLGSGTAPVAAVRQCAIDLGLKMVVESETCSPTGIAEVKRCMDYLRTLD